MTHPAKKPSRAQRARVHDAIGALQRLSAAFQRRRVQLAREVGLTEAQWSVLEGVSTEHFIPSLFAREQETSAAAVSKVLRQLTDKGLLVARVNADDARQRDYALTDEGTRTMDELRALRSEAIDAIWMDLDAASLELFTDFSRQLSEGIEAFATSERAARADKNTPRSKGRGQSRAGQKNARAVEN